jgi:uncharacterized protein (TIGR03905 family)
MTTYKTKGVCATEIKFSVKDDKLTNVQFSSGCPGNLQGISRLVEGMPVNEVIERLKGITCGRKNTSCPDQLATALQNQQNS